MTDPSAARHSEDCRSPFHFWRLSRDATGLSPRRYDTDRPGAVRKEMKAAGFVVDAETPILANDGDPH